MVSASTGGVVRYLTGPNAADTDLGRPTASPDRAWVYYSLTAATGTPGTTTAGTYRVPFAGGPAARLTASGSRGPAVSPTGPSCCSSPRSPAPGGTGWPSSTWPAGRSGSWPSPSGRPATSSATPGAPTAARSPASGVDPRQPGLLGPAVPAGRGRRWRTAVSLDAGGPVPEVGEGGLAWPAPRRVVFVAQFTAAGSYGLVGVDPKTGRRTPAAFRSRVAPSLLDLDASGRYLLYGTGGIRPSTWRLDTSGKGEPVRIGQFSAFDRKQTTPTRAAPGRPAAVTGL